MIVAAALLATLLIPTVWFFVRAQPRTERVIALKRFNVAVVVLALVAVAGVTLYFWETTGHSIDSAWWPILATLGSAFALCILLIVGMVVRLIVFRKSARRAD